MSLSKKYNEMKRELDKSYPTPNDSNDEYKKKKVMYLRARARLEIEFMTELLAKYKVSENPKAKLAYSMAWESGHSEGFSGVENNFAELVKLIR